MPEAPDPLPISRMRDGPREWLLSASMIASIRPTRVGSTISENIESHSSRRRPQKWVESKSVFSAS